MTTGELLYYAAITLFVLTITLQIVFTLKKPKHGHQKAQATLYGKHIQVKAAPLGAETVALKPKSIPFSTEKSELKAKATHLKPYIFSAKTAIKTIFLVLMIGLTFCSCSKASAENNWKQQYDLGVKYLSSGNYDEAIIAFTAAIEIDPKRSDAYTGLVDVYFVQNNYEKAAEVLSQGEPYFEEQQLQRYRQALDLLENNKQGVFITDLKFDLDRYRLGKPTQFLVTVIYGCGANVDGVIRIGANTAEPNDFLMINEDFLVKGNGRRQFQVEIVPKQWEAVQFGICVNLSETGNKDESALISSDILYIDADGNISAGLGHAAYNRIPNQAINGKEISAAIYNNPDFIKPEELTLGNIPFYEANQNQILAAYAEFMSQSTEIEQGILQCDIFSTNSNTWKQGVSVVFNQSQNNGLASSVIYNESSNGFYSADDTSSAGVVPELRDIKLYDSAEVVFRKLGIALQPDKVLLPQQYVVMTEYSYDTVGLFDDSFKTCEFFWQQKNNLGISLILSFDAQDQLQKMEYRAHLL
ncbi:MAG: tetratricopeptide repeat protein [Oscillospiraceae bacterium]|nr:tetratricopeptide repeat protein [Oscillospiraceae bacterium]